MSVCNDNNKPRSELNNRKRRQSKIYKNRRIAWLGHVMRTDDKRTFKVILKWKRIDTRIRGRPRKRWIVDIEEHTQIMEIRRWRNKCKERAEWKRITEKVKTQSGM
jgi:hypothetical protein